MFKRKAQEIFGEINELFPMLEISLNPDGKPKRGSFEIHVLRNNEAATEDNRIWSGISKGPPRKEKFPTGTSLIDAIKKHLK